jgi:hypothetical protein
VADFLIDGIRTCLNDLPEIEDTAADLGRIGLLNALGGGRFPQPVSI